MVLGAFLAAGANAERLRLELQGEITAHKAAGEEYGVLSARLHESVR
jgi:hypothetical protein